MRLSKRAIASVLPDGTLLDDTKMDTLVSTLNNLHTPLDIPLVDKVIEILGDGEPKTPSNP